MSDLDPLRYDQIAFKASGDSSDVFGEGQIQGPPRQGHGAFANLLVDAHPYRENLEPVKPHAGFVARGYNIVHRRPRDTSVDGGANILSGVVPAAPICRWEVTRWRRRTTLADRRRPK